jgi:hypothetical protein
MYGFDGHNEHLAARLEAFQDSGPTDLEVAPDGAATAAWTYRDGDPQFVLRVEAGGSSGIPSVSVHEVVYGDPIWKNFHQRIGEIPRDTSPINGAISGPSKWKFVVPVPHFAGSLTVELRR